MQRNRKIVHATALAFLFFLCAQMSHSATSDELDALKCRGVVTQAGILVREADRTALQISEANSDVCKFLQERFSPGLLKGAGSRKLEGLNPSFEKCLQGLFKGAEKATGLRTIIYDGYRTTADQKRAQQTAKIAASSGNSPHEYGIAVDIEDGDRDKRYKEYWKWIRANAGAYGLGVLTSEDGHIEARSAFCGVGNYAGKASHLKQAAKSANVVATYTNNPLSSMSTEGTYTTSQTYAGFMGTINNFLGGTSANEPEPTRQENTQPYNEISRLADAESQGADGQSARDDSWIVPKQVSTQRIQVQPVSLRGEEYPAVMTSNNFGTQSQFVSQENTFQQNTDVSGASVSSRSAWQKLRDMVSGSIKNLFDK